MRNKNNSKSPHWLRCIVCLAACCCVPGLVVAVCLGSEVTSLLVAAVGLYAIRIAMLAFGEWQN